MKPAELCEWCWVRPIGGVGQKFCSRKCRQAAYRIRKLRPGERVAPPGLPAGALFAYADPPYVGLSKYYRGERTYAGEVDHPKLIRELQAELAAGTYAGYALSCSSKSLRFLLPLFPDHARVCAWGKVIGANPSTYGIHSTWEPVVVVGGRQAQPGVRDWLYAPPDRGGSSDLIGRKPLAFAAWLFDLLGMVPGDRLADLFPGSNAIGRAWSQVSREYSSDSRPSPRPGRRRHLLPSALEASR